MLSMSSEPSNQEGKYPPPPPPAWEAQPPRGIYSLPQQALNYRVCRCRSFASAVCSSFTVPAVPILPPSSQHFPPSRPPSHLHPSNRPPPSFPLHSLRVRPTRCSKANRDITAKAPSSQAYPPPSISATPGEMVTLPPPQHTPHPELYRHPPYDMYPGHPVDHRGGPQQHLNYNQPAPRQRTAIACRYCRRRKVSPFARASFLPPPHLFALAGRPGWLRSRR